jgi:hypothetical protein
MARGIKRSNYKSLVLSRGYVAFNLCCISFQLCTGTPSWWNHNLCLILRGASNIVVRSLRNLWTLNFSRSRKRPTKRPRRYQPKIWSWSGLDICDRVRGKFVDGGHNMSTGSYVKVHPKGINMTDIRNLLSGEDGMRSACSSNVEIVSQKVLRKFSFWITHILARLPISFCLF